MIKKWVSFAGWLLALQVFGVAAAEKAPAATATATATAAKHHSLWRVQGKNNTVYLLGSIHVLKKDNYPLPAVIDAAYTNSTIVVFETEIGKVDDPAEQMKLLQKTQLPEGKTLETELSPAVYKALTNQAESSGLPMMFVNQFTPAMAAEALEGMELLRLGFDPAFGLDKHFYKQAKKDGKIIIALEPIEEQLDLINSLTKEEGEWFVKTTLKELDNVKKDFAEIIRAWETGDGAGLAKLLNEAKSESPALFKRFLTDRNNKWMPKIEELTRGKANAIVIVGAGHLVGKDGVVEMLKKRGYRVSQE